MLVVQGKFTLPMPCCAVLGQDLSCWPALKWYHAVQNLRGLHEHLQVEVQETFTDFLGSISKDSPKNTGMLPCNQCCTFGQAGLHYSVCMWTLGV